MINLFRKQHPVWLRDYQTSNQVKLPKVETELKYVVLDLETSGFDPHKDRILSVAVAKIEANKLQAKHIKEWVVYQEQARVNDAVKIHGILPSETREGEEESKVMEELVRLLQGVIVVGHHIRFDAAMLDVAFRRHFGIKFRNKLVDTADMARTEIDAFKKTGYANQRPPNLDEVCQQLGINPVDRHTAIGDVFTTTQVFLYLKSKMQQRLKHRFCSKSLPIAKF